MDLILNTYGTLLHKQGNTFVVVHKDGEQTVHPDKLKTIQISKGAQISSDAAMLAVDNEIDVMFVDNSGKPVARLWSIKYGSISTIRRKQLDFTFAPEAVEWIKDITIRKIDNQMAIMLSLQPAENNEHTAIDKAMHKCDEYKQKIRTLNSPVVSEIAPSLRGWEGAASRVYFEVISDLLPESYRFANRSQHPAMDVFNCLLNYGYGMMYGKVEGALIKAGIDPYVGVFHRDDYNRPVLAFDVIELFRVWIDFVVISLCMQQAVNEECYSIKNDGSYWLEALGKRILIQSVTDYLEEIISFDGLQRSRASHIELYAQRLAQIFLQFKS